MAVQGPLEHICGNTSAKQQTCSFGHGYQLITNECMHCAGRDEADVLHLSMLLPWHEARPQAKSNEALKCNRLTCVSVAVPYLY